MAATFNSPVDKGTITTKNKRTLDELKKANPEIGNISNDKASDFGCTSQVISILKELKLEHHGFEKNIDKAINQVLGGLDYL